jgi:hypothetical protein
MASLRWPWLVESRSGTLVRVVRSPVDQWSGSRGGVFSWDGDEDEDEDDARLLRFTEQ